MNASQYDHPQQFYTIRECMMRLGISRKTAEREIARGGLKAVYRYGPGGGRIVRVTAESIDSYYRPIESVAAVNGLG